MHGLISRRQALRRFANGFGMVALAGLLADEAAASPTTNPLALKPPMYPARARRVWPSVGAASGAEGEEAAAPRAVWSRPVRDRAPRGLASLPAQAVTPPVATIPVSSRAGR